MHSLSYGDGSATQAAGRRGSRMQANFGLGTLGFFNGLLAAPGATWT